MANLEEVRSDVAARLDEAVSVVVGRQGAEGAVDAAKLALADDAATAFRDLARDSLDDLGRRTSVAYTVDAELDKNEVFVLDDADDLAELADLTALADMAATLPITPPRDLDLGIQFYAVILGNDSRVTFVRRTDPRIAYRGGRWLAVAGERLTKLEAPAFSFSPGFDFVLGPGWAAILNQASFERLFREIGLIAKHLQGWVRGITDHLPMDAASEAELLRVAHEDSRTWRPPRDQSPGPPRTGRADRRAQVCQEGRARPEVRHTRREAHLRPEYALRVPPSAQRRPLPRRPHEHEVRGAAEGGRGSVMPDD